MGHEQQGVKVININKLPEKITVVINWEAKTLTVCRHSMDAYKVIREETLNGKPISYHILRRRLKTNQKVQLDSGTEVRESILIN